MKALTPLSIILLLLLLLQWTGRMDSSGVISPSVKSGGGQSAVHAMRNDLSDDLRSRRQASDDVFVVDSSEALDWHQASGNDVIDDDNENDSRLTPRLLVIH